RTGIRPAMPASHSGSGRGGSGTSRPSTASATCPDHTRSDEGERPGGGDWRWAPAAVWSSRLLAGERGGGEGETWPHGQVLGLLDQAVGDERIQHRQQAPSAGLLVEDVGEGDVSGRSAGLGGLE